MLNILNNSIASNSCNWQIPIIYYNIKFNLKNLIIIYFLRLDSKNG